MVVSPIRVARIIRAYESAAAEGNANAGRELRAWLAEYPPKDGTLRAEDLDAEMQERILARLMREIEEEDAANEHNP